MAFADLETVFGAFSSIFGASNNTIYMLGLILGLFIMSLVINLGIGFEAAIVIITIMVFVMSNFGLLPAWTMFAILLGGAIVIKNIVGYILELRA